MPEFLHRVAEGGCDGSAFQCPPASVVVVGAKRCVAGGVVASKMCHSVQGSANRTRCWMFGGALSDAFAFDAVLLRGERKGDVVCSEEL